MWCAVRCGAVLSELAEYLAEWGPPGWAVKYHPAGPVKWLDGVGFLKEVTIFKTLYLDLLMEKQWKKS